MTTRIALLRAVNVGGHNVVAMSDLRELLSSLGFADVRSLLQSGNLVFRCDADGAELEQRLESEAERRLGLRTEFMVRNAAEWQSVVDRNPFADAAASDPGRLLVMFTKSAPEASSVEALQAAINGTEIVRADGRQVYMFYPDGIGRSKLSGDVVERRLGLRGTARNWNTVLKLRALAEA